MTRFDTRLIDPDAKTVHAVIEEAFAAVSHRKAAARIAHTAVSVKRISNRTVAEPEGVEFWASRTYVASGIAGQVLVAWWTAISGRRYVRVLGRIVTPETKYLVDVSKLGTRPPVWHVFPDRVYRRRAGKANDLVTVCGCGAIGTEKSLGWAGPCCGPCFDFQEDHGQLPASRPALLAMPSTCLAVAGSADGRWVAAACAGEVRVWDLNAGAEPIRIFDDKIETDIAPQVTLSPSGEYLAITGTVSDGLRVVKLQSEKASTVSQIRGVEAVAFRPAPGDSQANHAGTLLADLPPDTQPASESTYFLAGGRVMVASPPDARAREVAIPAVEHGGPLIFSRDGSRLAVRTGQQIRIHETGGKTLATIPFPPTNLYRTEPVIARVSPRVVPQVAFSLDGAQVAIGYDQALAVHHAVTGERRFWDGKLPDIVSGVAFDPSGRWLYVGRRDGTLVAYRTDIISDERSVVFRWSLGPIRALAMCGDSLLTACDEGVQVWPMAKLLEGM
jgi:WD40 repeat protein